MTVDSTLRMKSGMGKRRNVLRRPERIALMKENGTFDEKTDSALGLRKTRVKTSKAGK